MKLEQWDNEPALSPSALWHLLLSFTHAWLPLWSGVCFRYSVVWPLSIFLAKGMSPAINLDNVALLLERVT